MAITNLYRDLLFNYAKELATSAEVTVDGVATAFALDDSFVEGTTVMHIVYLPEHGEITGARLLDGYGRELQTRSFNVAKGEDGFAIIFATNIEFKGAK